MGLFAMDIFLLNPIVPQLTKNNLERRRHSIIDCHNNLDNFNNYYIQGNTTPLCQRLHLNLVQILTAGLARNNNGPRCKLRRCTTIDYSSWTRNFNSSLGPDTHLRKKGRLGQINKGPDSRRSIQRSNVDACLDSLGNL